MKRIYQTTQSQIITENQIIKKNDFGSIQIINQGTENAYINDNILLEPGNTYELKNSDPCIVIDQDTSVRFTETGLIKKVLVEMIFNREK